MEEDSIVSNNRSVYRSDRDNIDYYDYDRKYGGSYNRSADEYSVGDYTRSSVEDFSRNGGRFSSNQRRERGQIRRDRDYDSYSEDDSSLATPRSQEHTYNSKSISRKSPRTNQEMNPPLTTVPVATNGSFVLEPLVASLTNTSMFRRTAPVTIDTLLQEDPSRIPRMTYCDLMILRIISNSSQTNLGPARVYNARDRNRNTTEKNYSRMILCKVFNETEGHKLVYVLESKTTNYKLWSANPTWRDDGTISIGTIIRLMSPNPIQTLMANDIPMIETRSPVHVMYLPNHMPEVNIQENIGANTSRAFSMNGVMINIHSTFCENTKCSGLFCDRQRTNEIKERNQACGCYSMGRRSSLVLDHSLTLSKFNQGQNWTQHFPSFSSVKFQELFLSGPISNSVRASDLDISAEEYHKLIDRIENITQLINSNGGFTTLGWYKRGTINDQVILGGSSNNSKIQGNDQGDNKIENGPVNYHLCVVYPTNAAFRNPASTLYQQKLRLVYNVVRLSQQNNSQY